MNVHILRSEDGCSAITLAPELKVLLFYQSSFNIKDHAIITSTNHPPPPLVHPHPQKWTIDLLFKNNRICKHVTNFKTSPPPLLTDVINVWTLLASIFKNCEWRDRILQSWNLLFFSVTTFFKCLISWQYCQETYLETQSKVMSALKVIINDF